MPFSSCEPCCAPDSWSRNVDTYRSSVLRILCNILGASGGGGDIDPTYSANSSTVGLASTAAVVSADPVLLFGVEAFYNGDIPIYVKFYNQAVVDPVSAVPYRIIMIPGAAGGSGVVSNKFVGIPFSTALAVRAVTGIANTDTTAPPGDVILNLEYRAQ